MSVEQRASSETTSLLAERPPSYHSTNDVNTSPPPSPTNTEPNVPPPPLNHFSRSDVRWILAGLWSAVLLGAFDGKATYLFASIRNCGLKYRILGTVVATLLTPIGSEFKASNQSSYIGTAYLLSVCCFTPLYGMQFARCLLFPNRSHGFVGRLADILGRKGAMLLALSLFGTVFSS